MLEKESFKEGFKADCISFAGDYGEHLPGMRGTMRESTKVLVRQFDKWVMGLALWAYQKQALTFRYRLRQGASFAKQF